MSPRYSAANLARNQSLATQLAELAAQFAIAWVRTQGPIIIPLIGARRRDRLAESLGTLDITLTHDQVVVITAVVPHDSVAGTRYAQVQPGPTWCMRPAGWA